MPKLPPTPFRVTATDRITTIAYKADTSVGVDGIFSVELDPSLYASAERLEKDPKHKPAQIYVRVTTGGKRVTGNSLDAVKAFIVDCAKDELKCDIIAAGIIGAAKELKRVTSRFTR